MTFNKNKITFINNSNNRYIDIFISIFLFFITLFFFNQIIDEVMLSVFNCRDISRAANWWNGQALVYGPETAGGGFTPGPFYYILLSPLLLAKANWSHIIQFNFILSSFSIALLYYFIARKWDRIQAILTILLIMSTPIFHSYHAISWNASFYLIFFICALITFIQAFTIKNELKKNFYYLLFFIFSSMAVQIHYTNIVLIFSAILAHLFGKKLKLLKPKKRYLFAGLIIFFIPMIPFFLWSFFDLRFKIFTYPYPNEFHNLTVNIFKYFEVVQQNMFSLRIFNDFNTSLLVVMLITILISCMKNNRKFWENTLSTVEIKTIFITLIACLVLYTPRLFHEYENRYIIPLFIIVSIICSYIFKNIITRLFHTIKDRKLKILSCVAITIIITSLSLTNIFTQFFSPSKSIYYTYYKSTINVGDARYLINYLNKERGWSLKQIRENVFPLNIGPASVFVDTDTKITIDTTGHTNLPHNKKTKKRPSGYFYYYSKKVGDNDSNWTFSNIKLPTELQKTYQASQIKLGIPILLNTKYLLPYYLTKDSKYKNFGGWGYPYLEDDSLFIPNLLIQKKTGTYYLENDGLYLLWNKCKYKEQNNCRIAIKASGISKKGIVEHNNISLNIKGIPLSQRIVVTSLLSYEVWHNVDLNLKYQDGSVETLPLLSAIGGGTTLSYKNGNDVKLILVAPLQMNIKLQKNKKLIQLGISIGQHYVGKNMFSRSSSHVSIDSYEKKGPTSMSHIFE